MDTGGFSLQIKHIFSQLETGRKKGERMCDGDMRAETQVSGPQLDG